MTQHIQHAGRGAVGAQLTVAQQISLIVGVAVLVLVLSLVRVQHLGGHGGPSCVRAGGAAATGAALAQQHRRQFHSRVLYRPDRGR